MHEDSASSISDELNYSVKTTMINGTRVVTRQLIDAEGNALGKEERAVSMNAVENLSNVVAIFPDGKCLDVPGLFPSDLVPNKKARLFTILELPTFLEFRPTVS